VKGTISEGRNPLGLSVKKKIFFQESHANEVKPERGDRCSVRT